MAETSPGGKKPRRRNRSKDQGTQRETRFVEHCVSRGIPAERKALAGADDVGDVWTSTHSIEVKYGGRFTAMTGAGIAEVRRQANTQAERAGLIGGWVIFPKGIGEARDLEQAYGQCLRCDTSGVIRLLGDFLDHLVWHEGGCPAVGGPDDVRVKALVAGMVELVGRFGA